MAGARPCGPAGLPPLGATFSAVAHLPFLGFSLAPLLPDPLSARRATALGAGAWGLWWVHRPLDLPAANVDLSVEPGTTPRGVAEAVAATGTRVQPQLLYAWFRFSGQDRQIRAGSYELERGVTPRTPPLAIRAGRRSRVRWPPLVGLASNACWPCAYVVLMRRRAMKFDAEAWPTASRPASLSDTSITGYSTTSRLLAAWAMRAAMKLEGLARTRQ